MGIFSRNKQIEERALGCVSFGNGYSNEGFICWISAVFQAITKISNSVAILPIVVKRGNLIDETHAFNQVFDNSNLGKFNFMKKLVWDQIMWGNGYAVIRRDEKHNPIGLIYVSPTLVNHIYTEINAEHYYLVNQYGIGRVEPEDILHFYMNTQDGRHGKPITFYGQSVFDICRYTGIAAEEFFSGGMNLSGILTVQGNPTQAEIENIRTNWALMHGSNGMKSPLAILRGNMQYQTVSQNSKDAQLLESRLFNVQEVARVFNISPALLGDLSHTSYNSLENTMLDFLSSTILPYISCFESELRRKLCGGTEVTIDLDEAYLLRADKASQANYLKTLVDSGIITRNEARRTLNLPPVDGGDDLIVAYTAIADNKIGDESKAPENEPEK